MVTPRFSFPPVTPPVPAFVACPTGLLGWMPADQAAAVRQAYQIAMARTQAVLAPSPVERLYARSAN
jgi:hypothetical protein